MWTTIYFLGAYRHRPAGLGALLSAYMGIRGERRKGGVFLHRVGGHRLVGNQHRRRFSF